jgi:hypothetical protein
MTNHVTKRIVLGIAACLLSVQALAQDHTRNWEEGTVWMVTNVQTKPNMLNAYVNDLSNVWRKFIEAQIEDGLAVSYKMFWMPFPRKNEPDLVLAVEYKNWAAFDAGQDYLEKQTAEVLGSLDDAQDAAMDREALRTIGSTYLFQEIDFKD